MNLYDQTIAAESAVSTYRSANIADWIAAIDPVLNAAGECTIGRDKVDAITVSEKTLTVRTFYSGRCCTHTNDMNLPISILKADNPIQEATRYRLGKELAEAKTRHAAAQRAMIEYAEKVSLLEAELASASV